MFWIVVSNLVVICFLGVAIVWGWVAFISQAIARRTGRTSAVPYPDEVLWSRFDKSLLDLGLFGGAPILPNRPQGTQVPHRGEVAGRGPDFRQLNGRHVLTTRAPRGLAHQGRR